MAVTDEVRAKYIPTIGIECHVQLNTKTKLFAAVGNDAREASPNTLISHICVGMPGALPVLNEKAVEYATRVALALNTEPQKFSRFERKHYFYPDLPKGYQISQYEQPIIKGGYVEIQINGEMKRININRVQLEEDAGKNTHPAGADYSLVDLNRAGTPLLEIVSEPDLHSPEEAKVYARELWLMAKYAGVTDGDLYLGHVRFDVNVSVSSDPQKPGIRAEVKNLNSFRSVEGAVTHEINRQIELLEKGESIVQETRGWDEAKQKTTSQRNKEEAEDYRYMPEPDIPPVELDNEFTEKIKSKMPTTAKNIRQSLLEAGVNQLTVEAILDNPDLAKRWNELNDKSIENSTKKRIADWLSNEVTQQLNDNPNINLASSLASDETVLNLDQLIKLSNMVDAGQLSSSAAKGLIIAYWTNLYNVEEIANKMNLLQVSDEGEIERIVSDVLAENPKAADDVRNGEMKAIGFLVGQVMKKSQGKANPGLAQEIIKRQLS